MINYPNAIEVHGQEYAINTGYEYAISCIACINDPELSDFERAYGVIGILYKEPPPDEYLQEAVNMAVKYLECEKQSNTTHENKRDMDFEYDDNYIKASFLSDYKIDLDAAEMHWYKFCILLSGLTDDCVLNRVRDLRNYDISTVKDAKSRQKLIKAKMDVALPERPTAEEQQTLDNIWEQLK